jgi:hypothetical protein
VNFFIEIGFLWLIVSHLFFLFFYVMMLIRDSTNFVTNVRVFIEPTSALPARQMSLIRALFAYVRIVTNSGSNLLGIWIMYIYIFYMSTQGKEEKNI